MTDSVGGHVTIGTRAVIGGLYGGAAKALGTVGAVNPYLKAALMAQSMALQKTLSPVGTATLGSNANSFISGAQLLGGVLGGGLLYQVH